MARVEVEVPTEVVADGWLCGKDVVGRGGLGWHGSHWSSMKAPNVMN